MITKNAVNYNGTIPEKYDVVAATHKVFAEYGNVGTDFEYITQEGFGWMNASYQYGLSLLTNINITHLNHLKRPEEIFTKTEKS
jgi:alpha,alpha-trehalase